MLVAVVLHLAMEIVEGIGGLCTGFSQDVSIGLIGAIVHVLFSVRLLPSVEIRIELCQGRHVDCS